jgi:hypothetical protein
MFEILVQNVKLGSSYYRNGNKVIVIAKVKYGATLEEEQTGKKYMVSPKEKLQIDTQENSTMETPDKQLGIMKVIKHILLTAPSTGLGVGDIIRKINEHGDYQIEDIKLRNLIYSHVWYLKKRKGYKNIATESKKYALRKEDSVIEQLPVVKKDPKYDDSSLFIAAKDCEFKKVYHSPKGIPCKLVEITDTEVQLKSLITNEIVSVSLDFGLVPEEKIIEKIGGSNDKM